MSVSLILEMMEKARESYKLSPQKFLITQREYDWLVSMYPGDDDVKVFMDEHYTVVMPYGSADTYVNEKLREGYLERLGSLASEQGFRVATDKKVPGVRSVGLTPSSVYIDEPLDSTEAYDEWSGRCASSTRMEYGMLRGGDVPARLSGSSFRPDWSKSSLSPAVLEGFPRIKVEL